MNRNVFKNVLGHLHEYPDKIPDQEQLYQMLKNSITVLDKRPLQQYSGSHNIIIVIEELAELTFELLQPDNNKLNYGILEEFADVTLGMDYLIEIFDLDENYIIDEALKEQTEYNDLVLLKHKCIICLSKLIQLLTKSLRKEPDTDAITQTIIQGITYLHALKTLYHISDETLQAACGIKMIKAKCEMEENPNYK